MRILAYGAGNIGSLYAVLLQRSGHHVTVLARGRRLADIRDHGTRLDRALGGGSVDVRVDVIEELDHDDRYDLVLVALPANEVPTVLPVLRASRATPSVMFFGNNAAGPGAMVEALGADRVLLGFPGAAAIGSDGRVRYLVTSRREQPTTIGELDGSTTPRIEALGGVGGRRFPDGRLPGPGGVADDARRRDQSDGVRALPGRDGRRSAGSHA